MTATRRITSAMGHSLWIWTLEVSRGTRAEDLPWNRNSSNHPTLVWWPQLLWEDCLKSVKARHSRANRIILTEGHVDEEMVSNMIVSNLFVALVHCSDRRSLWKTHTVPEELPNPTENWSVDGSQCSTGKIPLGLKVRRSGIIRSGC